MTILGEQEGVIGGAVSYSDGKETRFLANKTVNGNTLELTDMIFYPEGVSGNELKNEFGPRQMMETLTLLKQYANKQGYEKIRIQYERAANSSSKNPGHNFDETFNTK